MEEFTISFRYKNKDQKAGVNKLENEKEVEYNVRPIAREIVKKFGKQIRIFKTGQDYTIQHHEALADKEFYAAVINAIHQKEGGTLENPIKIRKN